MLNTGKLVICPTPLGNLGDITARSLDALRSGDVICAEDTRVTAKLLAAYDIQKRVERLDETMISKETKHIIERISRGQTVVFCSDAGMPGVSDPGNRLIRAVQDARLQVEVLPGASAGVTAYVASGFANPRFYFGGFFPRKAGERERLLESLRKLDAVLVFYESPLRLVSALEAVVKVFPEREVAVCRELTKLHEEVYRNSAPQVLDEFSRRAQGKGIKGEVVLVIDGSSALEQVHEQDKVLDAAGVRAAELKAQANLSGKDIAAQLQKEFDISRNAAYEIALNR
ncbi:MAG: 16S rRNA (cytidine(1402)-2'-O)-methyltransferase [Eggerthellaceae bacterium]|nr:16S rRNA (cytidine(1402)-2'-O)-methyltransferase [Eggerthellaceae bacterium]